MAVGFEASYAGRCGHCGEPFGEGDVVFYGDDDSLNGYACCGPDGANRPIPQTVDLTVALVVPRGKTPADRCGTCFQIPASNGVCGCQ